MSVKSLKDAAAGADARKLVVLSQDSYDGWLKGHATDVQKKYCATPGFNGKAGQVQPVYVNDQLDHYIVVMGDVGSPKAMGALPNKLPHGEYVVTAKSADISEDVLTLGWAMGTYRYDRHTQNPSTPSVLAVPFHADKAESMALAEVIWKTRDIINAPTNMMGVVDLTNHAKKLAAKFNAHANVTPVTDDKIFPLLWEVGKAAMEHPRMIEMTWGDGAPGNLNLTLVGKGVVYDTGGLALKPRDGMLTMKKDMGGAAHALGLAEMIMANNLPVNLRVILPVVENAINERAYRNGDIIKSRKGLTVEVNNTDAEGRLILADALTLAGEGSVKPDLIIDFATLTAAARTVGEPGTPVVICNDRKIAHTLQEIGELADDRLQPIALDERNAGKIKSPIADLANSGTALPSHIFAAHFLNAFSPKGVTRVHIDQGAWDDNGAKEQGLHTTYLYVKARSLGHLPQ